MLIILEYYVSWKVCAFLARRNYIIVDFNIFSFPYCTNYNDPI